MINSIALSLILTPLLMPRAHAAAGKTHVEIPVAYDDIKVFENGREILAKTLVRNSEEEARLVSDADVKAFKKLGVKSKREVIDKKLWAAYIEEVLKILAVKQLPKAEQEMFRVLDENGEVIRMVSLGEKARLAAASALPNEIGADIDPKAPDNPLLNELVRKWGREYVELRTQDFLYSNQPETYFVLLKAHFFRKAGSTLDWKVFSKVTFIDSFGTELWVKHFPEGDIVLSIGNSDAPPSVSDSGEAVALVTTDSEEGTGGEVLHVYGATGEEIFSYPGKDAGQETPRPSHYKLAANGRYLAYAIWLNNAPPLEPKPGMEVEKEAVFEITRQRSRTIFRDLKDKTSFEANRYLVHGISSDGIADVESYGIGKMTDRKKLDLKKFLK